MGKAAKKCLRKKLLMFINNVCCRMTVDVVFYHTWNAFSKSTKRKQAGISALLATGALLKCSFYGQRRSRLIRNITLGD